MACSSSQQWVVNFLVEQDRGPKKWTPAYEKCVKNFYSNCVSTYCAATFSCDLLSKWLPQHEIAMLEKHLRDNFEEILGFLEEKDDLAFKANFSQIREMLAKEIPLKNVIEKPEFAVIFRKYEQELNSFLQSKGFKDGFGIFTPTVQRLGPKLCNILS